ncbi:MAG: hypothetical protein IH944_02210 [Armatimonadetes bacterium]|nr:hypothetical protein [Armatimonadota bacterium]
MDGDQRRVLIDFSHEEAFEILMRCLESTEHDTPVFRNAIRILACAIRQPKQEKDVA